MAKHGCKVMVTKVQTASSMQEIYDKGVYGAEIDIRVTSDGIYVIRHDAYVTDSEGTQHTIADNTYADLKAYDSTLLTLAESIALTDGYGFVIVYDMKINDSIHCDNIWNIFVENNANLKLLYMEPYSNVYLPLWVAKDKRINYAVGSLTTDVAEILGGCLTGLNHAMIIGSVAESTDDVWTDELKEKIHHYNLDVVVSNILNTNSNMASLNYPYTIAWTPYVNYLETIIAELPNYEDEEENIELSSYLKEIADEIRTAYGVSDTVNALHFKDAIRYIAINGV